MKTGRLKIALISLFAIFATLFTQQTLAFYSTTGTATNVVTSGDVSIAILEKTKDGKDFPTEGVYVLPGTIVSKIVTVANTGTHPCWVRVKLTDGAGGSNALAGLFDLDINTTDWITGEDGYYYYKTPLEAGAATAKLFSQVKVAGDAQGVKAGSTLQLTVTAFAVQSENNGASSPTQVAGWPAES